MSGFDLGQFDTVTASNQGAAMQVLHPVTNVPTGVEITLAGADSDVYRRAQRTWANKQMDRLMKRRGNNPSVEEIEERSLDIMARCTLSWKDVEFKGKKLPCNYENAIMLYRELPWLREQVDEFINDRANFLAS